ncbi:hypothetical protein RUND412_002245 [Rhizina undulata]
MEFITDLEEATAMPIASVVPNNEQEIAVDFLYLATLDLLSEVPPSNYADHGRQEATDSALKRDFHKAKRTDPDPTLQFRSRDFPVLNSPRDLIFEAFESHILSKYS